MGVDQSVQAQPAVRESGKARLAAAVAWPLLLAAGTLLPFWGKSYLIFQFTMVYIYAIAILGLKLLTGYNGQLSIGHGAFFALGAYVTGVLLEHSALPLPLLFVIAAGVCFVLGVLFGLPALRLEGSYLALATFALAIAVPQLLKFSPLEAWTGGVMGMMVSQPAAPFGLPLEPDQWLYLLSFLFLIGFYLLTRALIGSRTGRAWMALRDNPLAARAMGINAPLYKTLAFGVSAMYTGVAGALGALAVQFISPDSYTVHLSIVLLVGLVIGGVNWLPGALIGGLFILFLPNLSESISKDLAAAVYGVLLILVVWLPSSRLGTVLRFRK